MLRKVAIKDLRPNPFRRLEEYPIQREKVEALKLSIGVSGFWSTIIGRPAAGGTVEIAFGHHRQVALQEVMGPDDEVEIIVKDLSNEDMLRMMANENMAEWGSDGSVEVETIRTTIEAYGRGLVKLPEVPKDTPKKHIRNVRENSHERLYTAISVATFLGWTNKDGSRLQPDFKCKVAFAAIDAMRDGIVSQAEIRGLARYKIKELVDGARAVQKAEEEAARRNEEAEARAREQATRAASAADRARLERQAEVHRHQAAQHKAEAKERPRDFAQQASERFQQKGGLDEVRNLARTMAAVPTPESPKIPDVNGIAEKVVRKLFAFLNGDDDLSGYVSTLKEFKGELSSDAARRLCQEAAALRGRLKAIEDVFGSI